ncbi:hypothetical protein A2U01_0014396, partial [Trifolium medium]|nr:hypothetical protein [Trifolium medium]
MKVSQDRQKSYADKCRRPLEFEAGEHVFLRVTPTTGVGRALKARKLTPKFIGPYQITERIGKVAYRIALPPLKENLSFEVPPVKIADRKMKCLRTKEIPLVMVIWNEATGDATWEFWSWRRAHACAAPRAVLFCFPIFSSGCCAARRGELRLA